MANQVFEPNQFVLQDEDTQINYSISNKTGIPQFDYQSQSSNASYHFSGHTIEVLETAIGRLITVPLSDTNTVQEETLTLLLPIIYLPAGVMEHSIQTEVIFTTRCLPQAGARRGEGQVETYKTRSLHGKAYLIEF